MGPSSAGSSRFIGVDLGGTKTLAVLADSECQVVTHHTAATQVREGPGEVVAAIERLARGLAHKENLQLSDLRGLGVAFAGLYDTRREAVNMAPNLPGWEGYPLQQTLEREVGIPVAVGTDVNLAALAEHRYGAGVCAQNMLFVAVGTGIGGGLVLGGQLYQGQSGVAGEIGHMVLDPDGPQCSCGRQGCLEALASGSALALLAQDRLGRGEPSILIELCGGRIEKVVAEMVFEATRQGDTQARSVVEAGAQALGIGLASLLHLLNPDMVVIGGGVATEWELYIRPAVEHMRRVAFSRAVEDVVVVPSQLGGLAAALGAVVLVQEKIESRVDGGSRVKEIWRAPPS